MLSNSYPWQFHYLGVFYSTYFCKLRRQVFPMVFSRGLKKKRKERDLTWSNKSTSSSSSNLEKSIARWPVTNSNNIIPYPKTSVRSDDLPVERYSGAMWPIVPLTWVVTDAFFTSTSCASPKSPTTGKKSSSSNTFAAFTSRWMIFGLQCSCRYSRPRAVPSAIRFRVGQSMTGSLDLNSAHRSTKLDYVLRF